MNYINDFIAFMTLVVGIVTVIWFISDVKKQNSKVLKSILDVQKTQLEVQKKLLDVQTSQTDVQKTQLEIQKTELEVQKTLLEIQTSQTGILVRIEEGQRIGFQMLADSLKAMQDGIQKELRYVAELLAFKKQN